MLIRANSWLISDISTATYFPDSFRPKPNPDKPERIATKALKTKEMGIRKALGASVLKNKKPINTITINPVKLAIFFIMKEKFRAVVPWWRRLFVRKIFRKLDVISIDRH